MYFTDYTDCAVRLAVALANSGGQGRAERLADRAGLQRVLDEVSGHSLRVTASTDLEAVRRLRDRLRRVFETDDVAVAAAVLNTLFAEAGAQPRLTDHDGEPWHLHVTAPDAPLPERLAAESAMGLATVIAAHGLERFRVCMQDDCDDVFVDATRNRSRRFCDPATCGNRAHVAAYRRRQRAGGGAAR